MKKSVLKKDTLVQLFSCRFCKIFKNTSFNEDLRATASAYFNFNELSLSHKNID